MRHRHIRISAITLIAAYALLLAALVVPGLESTTGQSIDLTSRLATAAYWTAESGGPIGGVVVGVVMWLLLVTRPGIDRRRRLVEALVVATTVAICAGGGAALNEHVVKTALRVPRPNIADLAGLDGDGPLGMSPDEFYDQGEKLVRSRSLRSILQQQPPPVKLSPRIREHWIAESGYSFPSGHSFSAFFLATFYLALGTQFVSPPRLWLYYLLLPWAVAVCYSRVILRVHTSTDIVVGGLEGMVFGLLAWLLARKVLALCLEKYCQPHGAVTT